MCCTLWSELPVRTQPCYLPGLLSLDLSPVPDKRTLLPTSYFTLLTVLVGFDLRALHWLKNVSYFRRLLHPWYHGFRLKIFLRASLIWNFSKVGSIVLPALYSRLGYQAFCTVPRTISCVSAPFTIFVSIALFLG